MNKIVGIDLSGPANKTDTCAVVFQDKTECIIFENLVEQASDRAIIDCVSNMAKHACVLVGLDAPLSYNPGGGDRPADTELRKRVIQAGLRSGTVMAPTMTRMAYLTLRGISLTRALSYLPATILIVEVHPSAAMVLHGAPVADIRDMRRKHSCREKLLQWLSTQQVKGIPGHVADSDHAVAACAAALATWRWSQSKSAWLVKAQAPTHPFDFAC
ncbi:MAG: DUF429 domain-containing protein [Phycisphaerae bacterium]|nr:DUF429 domain-containing protein [Phycisphaerae bacterium]